MHRTLQNDAFPNSNQGYSHHRAHGGSITRTEKSQYKIRVSTRFIIVSFLSTALLAFAMGRVCRIILLHGSGVLLAPHDESATFVRSKKDNIFYEKQTTQFPTPKLIDGKESPSTSYTAKNFDTAIGFGSASVYLTREDEFCMNNQPATSDHCDVIGNDDYRCNDCKQCSRSTSHQKSNAENDSFPTTSSSPNIIQNNGFHNDDKGMHLPSGQHLLVDIKNVDGTFLNSEVRLAQAMVDVVNESNLTLLSYHCHKLIPLGVSCVGVLLESHISFHTWPEDGVISLDLFTCGSGELVPVLPIVKRIFEVPIEGSQNRRENKIDAPTLIWTHKLRGFNPDYDKSPLADDLGKFVLEVSSHDLKVEVATTQTAFQRIDIYDTIDGQSGDYLSYTKSLSNDGSYQSKYPEFFNPDREIYLDGVLQSTRKGNEPYHESLVHPALFAHPDPKQVGIIGGGEGSTLREVLKHRNVGKVRMVEIDEDMVSFSRKYLPDWNSCSDIAGSAEWCGDDERVEIIYEDALRWFKHRFSHDPPTRDDAEYLKDKFDVLIMDALDPQDDVPFAEVLYNDIEFFKNMYNALTDDGIVVLQLGEAPFHGSPPESVSGNGRRDFVMRALSSMFQSLHVYAEGNCGFRGVWSFAVAFKGSQSEALWYRNAAEIDAAIRTRIIPSISGTPQLKYFDGTTMQTVYQHTPKTFEVVYCRSNPTPASCVTNARLVPEGRKKYDPFLDRHRRVLKKTAADKSMVRLCEILSKIDTDRTTLYSSVGRIFGQMVSLCT